MPLIQIPDYSLKLQRALRLTNPPDSVLGPEIVGVILVDDLTKGGRGTIRKCAGVGSAGAVVAETAIITLTHATAAGQPREYLATCTRVIVSSSVNVTVNIAITGAPVVGLAVSGESAHLNLDNPGRPTSPIQQGNEAVVVANNQLYRCRVGANDTKIIDTEIFLGSQRFQNHVFVFAGAQNVGFNCSFEWTEE